MPIVAAEVRRIAALARIELDDEGVERFRRELESILGYMRMLDELPLDGCVEPRLSATIRDLREDRARSCFSSTEALASAPEHDRGLFRVPRMLEADDS